MKMKDLAPWNWFKNEQERGQKSNLTVADPFEKMRSEMSRFFDQPSLNQFNPSVNIKDNGNSYLVNVEVAGVDKEDINVKVEQGLLHIHGEKKEEKKEEKDQYYWVESSYGSFHRTLNLPENADEENVKANYKNGILNIEIGKKNIDIPTSGKKVPIE